MRNHTARFIKNIRNSKEFSRKMALLLMKLEFAQGLLISYHSKLNVYSNFGWNWYKATTRMLKLVLWKGDILLFRIRKGSCSKKQFVKSFMGYLTDSKAITVGWSHKIINLKLFLHGEFHLEINIWLKEYIKYYSCTNMITTYLFSTSRLWKNTYKTFGVRSRMACGRKASKLETIR